MQNLIITCEAVNSIDAYSTRSIEVQLSAADLDFLDSIPLKDVLRNLDATKLLQEYDADDKKSVEKLRKAIAKAAGIKL